MCLGPLRAWWMGSWRVCPRSEHSRRQDMEAAEPCEGCGHHPGHIADKQTGWEIVLRPVLEKFGSLSWAPCWRHKGNQHPVCSSSCPVIPKQRQVDKQAVIIRMVSVGKARHRGLVRARWGALPMLGKCWQAGGGEAGWEGRHRNGYFGSWVLKHSGR